MYTLSTPRSRWHGAHDQHVEGRVPINGRRVRYEAGYDLCCFTLQILTEFLADIESEFFHCIHEKEEQVRELVARGEALRRSDDSGELGKWQAWLRDVADLIPYLWD